MSTTGTKVPSVYRVPSKADPELKQFAESIKEAVEIRLGRRGDPRDRAITLRELIDSGMAKELLDNPFDPNAGVGTIDFEGTTVTDFTIPPTPTGFSVAASYTSFILSWDNPQMGNFAFTEVWRNTSNNLGSATKVDTTSAFVWSEEVGYAKTFYYWVRHVSTSGIEGAFSPSSNHFGTTSIDIAAVMTTLGDTLADLPGYTTLTNLINSSASSGAIAATVIRSTSAPTTRSGGGSLQANDLWVDTDDNNQLYVRNSSNNGWEEARDGTLVTLVNTINTQQGTNTTAIATANTNIATLTTANTARVSDISTINSTINNPSTGLAAAHSAIASEATTRASADSANATNITNLTSTVNAKTQTFVQNNAPTAVATGDLWIDSNDNNKLYRWNGSSWVVVRDTANDGKTTVFTQTSAPTANNTGDLWFDSDDSNRQYRWNGSSWVQVRDVASEAAINSEATTRANADSALSTSISNLTTTVGNNTTAISNEATARANGDSANATAISTLETNTNNALGTKATTASVTAVQNALSNGTSAQAGYGVAVNANGAVAGMYIMANSSGTLQNNTSTTNIIFEAGQVTIRNPHGSNAVPFTVLTSTDGAGNPAGVYIDTGFIKNAAITAAQIGSLSANLVNAVNINAGSIDSGTLSADRIAGNSISGVKISAGSLDVAGKSITDSIGRIAGIAGQSGTVTEVAELNRGSFNQKPFHICTTASTAASPDHVLGEVLSSPLFTHQFTTYNFSGNRTFIIQAGVDYEGSVSSATESLFVMSMRQTSSTSAYTSTNASDYLASEQFSGSGNFAIGIKNLNAQVTLTGNTTYTIWCFGKIDDVSGTHAGDFEGGYIQVFGLNK